MLFDNEERIKNQIEEDTKKREIDMALYGYTSYETDFFQSKSYEKLLIEFIRNKHIHVYNYGLVPRTTRVIRDNANKIIVAQTNNIDRKVLYLENSNKVIQDFIAQYGELDESKYDAAIKYLKKSARKREVTSLPINWMLNDYRNGQSKVIANFPDDIEIIKKYPIISNGINMINENDDLSTTVLVHEMTHALTDRHKGIVENYLHNEILTIYMELVAAFELDESEALLEIATLSRLENLKNNIITSYQNHFNGYEIDLEEVYVDSALYAFALFEEYRKASNKSRKSINNEINQTLSGNRQLEETLKILDVTEEEGSHIIRNNIKTIMK